MAVVMGEGEVEPLNGAATERADVDMEYIEDILVNSLAALWFVEPHRCENELTIAEEEKLLRGVDEGAPGNELEEAELLEEQ